MASKTTTDIFCSYNWSSKYIVYKIVDKLQTHFSVWIDRDLNPGLHLFEEIEKAIKNCRLFLCFITKDYCESPNCVKELTYASSLKKQILPIMLEKDTTNGIGLLISNFLRFNAYKDPDVFEPWSEILYEKLINTILKLFITAKTDVDTVPSSVKEDQLIDLLSMVHQFGSLEFEHSLTCGYLQSKLNIKNVCSVYQIAYSYKLKQIANACSEFIEKNIKDLISSSGILKLSNESLAELIERDSFFIPEIELVNIVKKWHEINSKDDIKTNLVNKIRLPLMKVEELCNEVRKSMLFSADTILDAIQIKLSTSYKDLKHRGILYPNENLATTDYGATVINGDNNGFNFDHILDYTKIGWLEHKINKLNNDSCIIFKLGNLSIFNQIKFLLWDKTPRSYSYYIEVSINETDWVRIVDYRNYLCRSWQTLQFEDVIAQYIKVVGTRNTINTYFHLVSIDIRYVPGKKNLIENIIVPTYNVASIKQHACVLEGRCPDSTPNAIINGDYKNFNYEIGYTEHMIGDSSIVIQLAQPYLINSMRLLLWDKDDRIYKYFIETSLDQTNWSIVADRRNEECRSWQIIVFPQEVVSFIRITGTHNSINKGFHCVYLECPCQEDELQQYLEKTNNNDNLVENK